MKSLSTKCPVIHGFPVPMSKTRGYLTWMTTPSRNPILCFEMHGRSISMWHVQMDDLARTDGEVSSLVANMS